jgi:hypothetical protein
MPSTSRQASVRVVSEGRASEQGIVLHLTCRRRKIDVPRDRSRVKEERRRLDFRSYHLGNGRDQTKEHEDDYEEPGSPTSKGPRRL